MERKHIDYLKTSIEALQQEALHCTEMQDETVRWMREGISLYLDEIEPPIMGVILLRPDLQFRTDSVSFERVRGEIILKPSTIPGWSETHYQNVSTPVEGTASQNQVWLDNIDILLQRLS